MYIMPMLKTYNTLWLATKATKFINKHCSIEISFDMYILSKKRVTIPVL